MKKALLLTLSIFIVTIMNGQVQNGMFEEWDLLNGREKPAEWYCPNLCPSPTCGPCDKIEQSINEFAVRIHNVMPCIASDNQAKSRNAGFIEDYIIPEYDKFNISFDLIIDSLESPAEFIFTLRGKKTSGWSDSILVWTTNELQSKTISHDIELIGDYDSLYIQFKSIGYLKNDAKHDCDLGYISGIIDNVETSQIVNAKEYSPIKIEIYPNPFVDEINIKSIENIEHWKIHDMNGKKILEGRSTKIENLNWLKSGIYLLTIVNCRQAITWKIMK